MDEQINQLVDELNQYENKIDTSKIKGLIQRYLLTRDEEMKRFLFNQIIYQVENIRRNLVLSTISKKDNNQIKKNGIKVGKLNGSIDYFISELDINRNILITGSVGHGKTSLVANIIKGMIDKGIKFIVFDLKRDYRSFALDKNTFAINTDEFRINPLEAPPNISLDEWAMHVADIFSHAFSLLLGSRNFLVSSIMSLYNNWKREYPPSLYDLLRYIELQVKPNDYSSVVINRLRALLVSTKVFDCNHGLLLDKISDYNLIFNIDKLGLSEQRFFVIYVLSYLYFFNSNSNKRNLLDRVIVIDDAHTILDVNQELEREMGIPLIHTIVSKSREFGIGFIFADQQISSLISASIMNTNIKFIGRMNILNDLNKIVDNSILFEAEQKVRSLDVGEFLLLSSEVQPYGMVKVDYINIDKSLDDKFIRLKNSLHKDLFDFTKYSEKDEGKINFIEEILKNPFVNITQHQKNLSSSMSKDWFSFFRKELINDGIIYEITIRLDKQREAKYLYVDTVNLRKFERILNRDISKIYNVYGKEDFIKGVLRKLVIYVLRRNKIKFESDETGILIPSKKTYITFMHDTFSLAKLVETPFDHIYDIIPDFIDPYTKLIEVMKLVKTNDMSSLRFLHFNTFLNEPVIAQK